MAAPIALGILLVEAGGSLSHLLLSGLEGEGYHIQSMPSVAEAVSFLHGARVEVLIVDHAIDRSIGAGVASLCGLARPRVCVLATDFDVETVRAPEYDVILRKPVTVEVVVAAIRAHTS